MATLMCGVVAWLWVCCNLVFRGAQCDNKIELNGINYGIVSAAMNGEPCLSTCINGLCYVDHHLFVLPCKADYVAGVPTHHTALYRGDRFECKSNCGKFGGYSYNWCYTDDDYSWDYCNPDVKSPTNVFGSDIYGNHCVDTCAHTYKLSTPMCLTSLDTFDYCAPPAKVPVQSCSYMFPTARAKRSPLDKIFSDAYCLTRCGRRVSDGRNGATQDRIDAIYSSGIPVTNTTVFPQGAPYTFVASTNRINALGEVVYLPLILQATLRRPPAGAPRSSADITQAARSNVDNMYNGLRPLVDVGHMVGFAIGGTRDLYNYVGQHQELNRGPFKIIENEISNFINFGGSAELTIAVDYRNTVPVSFAIKLKLINADGSLHSDCLDIILDNI